MLKGIQIDKQIMFDRRRPTGRQKGARSLVKNKYANDVIRLHNSKGAVIPKELMEIYIEWGKLADQVGDIGSCVLGAGFVFKYRRKWYFLTPNTCWQGCISWETHKEYIESKLKALGVTELHYEWGNMD
jgi:hypothetical protein